MTRRSGLVLALLLTASAARGEEAAFPPWGRGPLPVRDLMLLEVPVLGFVPESPRVLSRGEVEVGMQVATGNSFLRQGDIDHRMDLREAGDPQPPGYGIAADGEATVLRLEGSFGLGAGTELRVSAPIVLLSGGVLDSIIDLNHEIFGLPDGGRSEFSDGRLEGEALGQGVEYGFPGGPGVENGVGVGDVLLEGRFALGRKPGRTVGSALSVLFEAPTGDPDAGRGTGKPDLGLLLAFSGRAGARGFLYGNAAWFALGDPDAPSIRLRDPFHAMIAYEYRFNPRWSALGQVQGSTSVWPSAPDLDADEFRAHLAGGFRWGPRGDAGHSEIHAGFLQNLTLNDNNADFTLFFGASFRL